MLKLRKLLIIVVSALVVFAFIIVSSISYNMGISYGEKNAEEILISNHIMSDLRELIEHLPEDQKEVLKMRYYRDLSFKEISEVTNVSINTALGRMRYAILNLRKLIEKHNIQLQIN